MAAKTGMAMLVVLLLAACGGGMELGGPGPGATSEQLLQDDPMDSDVINEGTGSVIE